MKKEIPYERILNSLDSLKKLEPNPFLTTQVLARMEPVPHMGSWKWITASVSVCLLILTIITLTRDPIGTENSSQLSGEFSYYQEDALSTHTL